MELLLCGLGFAFSIAFPIAGEYWHSRHPSPYASLAGDRRFSHRWAYTDRGRAIRIRSYDLPPPDASAFEAEDAWLYERALVGVAIRTGNPGPYSNCFGWAFTGGRFAVDDDINAILEDNGYEEVRRPMPGDLVAYDMDGAIFHVGIVRDHDSDGEPIVESKWGARARYHHPVRAYPGPPGYPCVFYRSPRQGHQLKGLVE